MFSGGEKGRIGNELVKKTAVNWLEISLKKGEHESISNGLVCFTDTFFRK